MKKTSRKKSPAPQLRYDYKTMQALREMLRKAAPLLRELALRELASNDPGACLYPHSPEAAAFELAEQIEKEV
jgi:hypothetical protein